jgi:hypothetical protein
MSLNLKEMGTAPKQTPEEAAAMDAAIQRAQRSVGARDLVTKVRAAKARGLTREAIETEVGNLKEEFPRLFEMLYSSKYSEAMLNAMLRQLEAVEQGQRTTHEASVAVGTVLVNKFVRPKLGMEKAPLPGSE